MPGAMGKPSRRLSKVSDLIQSEVAMLLLMRINDPRVKNVTITSVTMTSDLKRARIFYSCAEDRTEQAAAGLESAKGYLRSHLAKELGLRYVPELEFKRDLSLLHQERMEKLLREIDDSHGTKV